MVAWNTLVLPEEISVGYIITCHTNIQYIPCVFRSYAVIPMHNMLLSSLPRILCSSFPNL